MSPWTASSLISYCSAIPLTDKPQHTPKINWSSCPVKSLVSSGGTGGAWAQAFLHNVPSGLPSEGGVIKYIPLSMLPHSGHFHTSSAGAILSPPSQPRCHRG